MKIYLFRHGQTVYNADGERFCGTSDVGLTALGWQQARRAARLIRGVRPVAIVHSGLRRSLETAMAIRESLQGAADCPLVAHEGFREVGFGAWEGLTRAEVNRLYPELYAEWLARPEEARIPGGDDLYERQQEAVDAFLDVVARYRDGDLVIVAHNTLNRLLILGLMGLDARHYRRIVQENACLNILEYHEEEGVRLHALNRVPEQDE